MTTALDEPTIVDEAAGSDRTGAGATETTTRRYTRSPQDVLRILVLGTAALVLLGLTLAVEDAILAFEEDVVEIFDFVPPAIVRVLHGSIEVVAGLVALAIYAVPLITRRYRLFGYIVLASIIAVASMTALDALIDRQTSAVLSNRLAIRAGVDASATSSVVGLAQLAAQLTVVQPFIGRRWRTASGVALAVVVLLSLVATTELPLGLFAALPLGGAVGSLVLLAFGRPDRRPTETAIRAALVAAGLPAAEVHPASVDARGSTPYFGTLDDGTGLFVKVLGAQERSADLLFRIYRFLRLKDVGDDRPFSSLRRTVEHEALLALMARDVDIRTPRLRGVVDVGADSMLLAYEQLDGRSLDGVADSDVTDDLMLAVWDQIAMLRRHRIAHRDLRRANVFVDDERRPWVIDFGFSELAVSDEILDADVAQMLCSFAVVTGAERAVAAAVASLGQEAVGRALPRLQMKALSGATQTSLKEHKGLLDELHEEVLARTDVSEVELASLDRIDRNTVFTIVVLAAATYFLFPQLTDVPGIFRQIREADWAWTPLLLLGSAGTYVGAAASLAGAVPARLPAGPMLGASVGSSFASKLAPAGLGGMALNVRFLQKQGVDEPVAVTGVGLNTIAGLVGHVSLTGVFVVWAGRDAFGSFELPDPRWFLIGAGIALALAALSMAVPRTRQIVLHRLVPVVRRALDGTSEVLRRPGKLAMLLGGSISVTFFYIVTLYFATQAFGGGLAFATVGAIYLVGQAVAQAAPTPGGLGAVEAALIGGLVAAGMDDTIAVPAVFMYRLFTFWVPILPGWLAFTWLQRNDYL
ncbi:MAG: flippase-like domain-containing protein [Actinomycetota bacterium]|nr:flippase-like domain-containing protein [Actinomycetota bacterium]